MKRTTLRGTLIVLLAALTFAAPAAARYFRHKPRCHAGYVAKRVWRKERRNGRLMWRHGKAVWVRRWECKRKVTTTATTTLPAHVSYSTSVDPTFTQASADPLAVTYAYSADAVETYDGVTTNLATIGQLPDGVLNFYSATTPGQPAGLVCSMQVGGATDGGPCQVDYTQTGTYQVTTEYIPNGASAATETDVETISPYPTTTTLPYTTVPDNGCSCSTTTYTPTVTDQNGNAVSFADGEIVLSLTDTTTGQWLGDLYDPYGSGQSVTFVACASGQPNQYYVGLDSCGGGVGSFAPSDALTAQATYQPSSNSGWTGSSSTPTPVIFSP